MTLSNRDTPENFRIRSIILTVYIPAFLLMMGQAVILPTLPTFSIDELGASLVLAGLVVSAKDFGTMVFDVPAGMLASRLGLRNSMIIGVLLFMIAAIGAGFSNNYWVLFATRILAGGSFALWSISRFTYMALTIPSSSRGKASAVFGGVGRTAFIVGPLAGGFAAEFIHVRAPFFIQACLAVVTLVIVLYTSRNLQIVSIKQKRHGIMDGFKTFLHGNKRVLVPAAMVAVTLQFQRKMREIFPLWGKAIGLSESDIGTILSISGVADTLMFPISGFAMDNLGRKFTAVPAFLLLASSMAVLYFADGFGLMLFAAVLGGVGNGLTSGFILTMSGDLAPKENPGDFIGVWRLITDGGASAGPLSISAIAQTTSLSLAALVAVGIGLFGALVAIFFMRDTSRIR